MYQTFMNAYTLVDTVTRRKLDEMLKTWKEPVPGSLDTRPVFPPEITRNIENALIKARTAALQHQQPRIPPELLNRNNRGGATPPGWTNSPTPPQGMSRPPAHPFPAGQASGPSVSTPPRANAAAPTHLVSSQAPPMPRPDLDLESLHRDLEALVTAARMDFANNPFNATSQQRLKALLDLQGILSKQQLTPDQLKMVREQVSALAGPLATPVAQNNTPLPPPAAAQPPPAPVSTPPAQPTSQPIQQLLNPGTLAELIKATAVHQQPTPPPIPAVPQVPSASSTPPTSSSENPLIAALRARGILPSASAPPNLAASTVTPPQGGSLPFIIPGQLRSTPPVPAVPPVVPINASSSSVLMSTASMKM